ncbi:MAG TPA: TonB family protein [Vicinamibacterales bacterium]|nr:TonB family protein [Vicinamibacterales bacterium]
MAERTPTGGPHVNASAGHLSVRVEGAHPPEVTFSFESQSERLVPAFGAALVLQVAIVLLFVLLARFGPTFTITPAALPEDISDKIVWLSQPGPGGGGGGGGNQMKEPPKPAELPGKDKITVPVDKPRPLEPPKETKVEPPPTEPLNIPAKILSAGADSLPGAIDAPSGPPTVSLGTGTGGGAGTGTGSGIGSGTGSGLGPGSGGGTGGGFFQPGNGVTTPRLIREVKPTYTSDAMRAKVQGSVWVQCIVQPDGSVTNLEVVRSLDSRFGLDEEAKKAARQWRFAPGTRMGQAVPVQITIELTFNLR